MTATYTMDDFINNKLAVRVNENNMMTFLKMCEEKGLVWNSGIKATSIVPSQAKCIAFGLNSSNTLTYSIHDRSDVYASDGYTFVDFSQIINPKYQIIIESDGNTTTAKMVVDGKEVKAATAKRNPVDKANWHIGAQTAFDRLWAKQEKPEKEKEYGGFKVGDRVVINAPNRGNAHTAHDKHGTIVSLENKGIIKNMIAVELDEPVYGHDCRGQTKPGCGCYAYAEKLRHEQPVKPEVREVKRIAKVGEWVKIVDAASSGNEVYKNGDILRVKKAYFDGSAYLSCGGIYACPFEYVVLEGYQP